MNIWIPDSKHSNRTEPNYVSERPGNAWSNHTCGAIRAVPSYLRSPIHMWPQGLHQFYQKYTEAYGIPVLGKWCIEMKNVVILMKFSSLAALAAVTAVTFFRCPAVGRFPSLGPAMRIIYIVLFNSLNKHCEGYQLVDVSHWGRVTHICVGKLTIIGSDNGLSPGRRQAIIRTNDGILLIGTLGTNFSEILIEIRIFLFKKMGLNFSSAKWRPFCLGLNVLKDQ